MSAGTSTTRCLLLVLAGLLLPIAPGHASPFITRKPLGHRKDVTLTRVSFRVDRLREFGTLFLPQRARQRPVPGIVYAHDGVSGLTKSSIVRCAELAHRGYVVLAPSYRGEDGSEGEVEVARGEVDDVLAAARVLKQLPEVDARRVAAIGTSHGALISILAAARSREFRAVVAAYGVMDIHAWWQYLKDHHYPVDDPLSLRVYGKGPQDRPQAFAIRSAVRVAGDIAAPVLLLQGDVDDTVPSQQADVMARALSGTGKTYEILHFPAAGHGFLIYAGDESDNDARRQAWEKIQGFLKRHL